MGISRNTATAAAYAASRAELPLLEVKLRIQTALYIFKRDMSWSKSWRKQFDRLLLTFAERVPHRIRPIARKNHHADGLMIAFAAVDEWSGQGGGGHE